MSDKNIDVQYKETFTDYLTKVGPLTIFVAGLLSLMPAMYLYFGYGVIPSLGTIGSAWAAVASTYGVIYIVEPISYFAVLGIAGTYMSFLSGNIGNMRLPAAALAQDVLEVDGASKKGELVATMAIAGSIITNILVLTVIALAGQVIIAALPEVVTAGFVYILSALFGGMIVMFAVKSIRSLFIALPLAYLLRGILKVKQAWMVILLCVFVTIAINVFLYMRNKKGGDFESQL